MSKEVCKGHINFTFLIFKINIVSEYWLSNDNKKYKKSNHPFNLLWSSPSQIPLKYSRASLNLHSILSNLLSTDDVLIVKIEDSLPSSIPIFIPIHTICPLRTYLYFSLLLVMVLLSGWHFSLLHTDTCLFFKNQLRYQLFYTIFYKLQMS